MPSKIDYEAIYTPLIEILEMEELPAEQRNKTAVKVMKKILSKKPTETESE